MPLKAYFGSLAKSKLHSEMGSPNIPAMESLRAIDAGRRALATQPHLG